MAVPRPRPRDQPNFSSQASLLYFLGPAAAAIVDSRAQRSEIAGRLLSEVRRCTDLNESVSLMHLMEEASRVHATSKEETRRTSVTGRRTPMGRGSTVEYLARRRKASLLFESLIQIFTTCTTKSAPAKCFSSGKNPRLAQSPKGTVRRRAAARSDELKGVEERTWAILFLLEKAVEQRTAQGARPSV